MFTNRFSFPNFVTRNMLKKKKKQHLAVKVGNPSEEDKPFHRNTSWGGGGTSYTGFLLYFSPMYLIILLWWDQCITVSYHKTSSWYVLSILLSSQQTVLQAARVFPVQFVLFLLHCMSSTNIFRINLINSFAFQDCSPKAIAILYLNQYYDIIFSLSYLVLPSFHISIPNTTVNFSEWLYLVYCTNVEHSEYFLSSQLISSWCSAHGPNFLSTTTDNILPYL